MSYLRTQAGETNPRTCVMHNVNSDTLAAGSQPQPRILSWWKIFSYGNTNICNTCKLYYLHRMCTRLKESLRGFLEGARKCTTLVIRKRKAWEENNLKGREVGATEGSRCWTAVTKKQCMCVLCKGACHLSVLAFSVRWSHVLWDQHDPIVTSLP